MILFLKGYNMTDQNIFQNYVNVLKNYVTFTGRANRPEYWYFVLVNFIVAVLIGIVGVMVHLPVLSDIYSLAVLLPSLAVGARRLHDTDRSGWWLLIGLVPLIGFIVLIVFFVQKGTEKEIRFGKPVA